MKPNITTPDGIRRPDTITVALPPNDQRSNHLSIDPAIDGTDPATFGLDADQGAAAGAPATGDAQQLARLEAENRALRQELDARDAQQLADANRAANTSADQGGQQ